MLLSVFMAMENAKRTTPPVDTSSWLTCAQVSDVLRISENTIRKWTRRDMLHPVKGKRLHANGSTREVDLYDPHEVAQRGSETRRLSSVPGDQGELAARAFEMFDAGKPLRDVVVMLRELPGKITELHDQWVDLGGSEIVIGRVARAELEVLLGPIADVADLVARVRDRMVARPIPGDGAVDAGVPT